MRRSLIIPLAFFAAACADTSPDRPNPTTSVETVPTETRQQAVVDANGPNWMVAGGNGLVELVGGSDGEPDQLTGRFALQGQNIVDAESGSDRWIVVGDGRTQALDDTATRLAEARDALSGEAISFIEPAPVGWLIGGANGRLQLLDGVGEPSTTEIQILDNTTINHAAFNGSSWLAVGENGNVVPVNQAVDLPSSPSGQGIGAAAVAVVAEPTGADLAPSWMVFTADSYVPVTGTGVPGSATQIESGLTITTAEFLAGNVYIGTDDGRVGVATYGPNPSFSFTTLFSGAAVTRLVNNGTDWIALADNGQAHRFGDDGAAIGSAVQISSDITRELVGAHWTGTQWRIVVGDIGFVAFVDDTLAAPRDLPELLNGEDVLDASAGDGQVLLIGTGGAYQLLDEMGNTVTNPDSLTGADLNAASWSGDEWLVVGNGGFAQIVDANGNPVGNPTTLLNGNTIHFAAWSGEFWLIGGEGGNYQLARTDGTGGGEVRTIADVSVWNDARWSGRDWLMVGESTTGTGITALTVTDQNIDPTPVDVSDMGPLNTVDFNGIEWLVGGADGLIQRMTAQGQVNGEPADVLTGFDIFDIYFNANEWLVVGEFGAVRRLGQDYLPIRAPIAVLDRFAANVVEWTVPRGHASGACLSNDACYRGPCVGGLASGSCCDRACDKPCESCFQNDTGEADGTCAPVAAGKRPVGDGCDRQSEATCGFTGQCDGAGECEYYGDEVLCADAVCSLGVFTPTAACTGTGTCEMVDEIDCAPYAGCSEEGCVTSCTADEDCVDGYICDGSECVEEAEVMEPEPQMPDDTEEGGCCATTAPKSPSPWWLALAALALVIRRRR